VSNALRFPCVSSHYAPHTAGARSCMAAVMTRAPWARQPNESLSPEAQRALDAHGGLLLSDGTGLVLNGWRIVSTKTLILGREELRKAEEAVGSRLLPEMLFGAQLSLTHEASGVALVFNATEALKEWRAEALPPVQVACAAAWASAHERRLREGTIRGWGAAAVATEGPAEDWTFTTPFGGRVVEGLQASGSGGHATAWCPVEERIDRAALLRRDPILFYDDLTLYESELDDNGSMVLSVKVRVMPTCWYVLLRYWLRVDGVLLRCVSRLRPLSPQLTHALKAA
jgi:type 2A phosphatase activator TIP41